MASVRWLATLAIGARTAFAVQLCPDPKLLPIPLARLQLAIAPASETELVPRVAAATPQNCEQVDPNDPALKAECHKQSPDCVEVYALVNRPGPVTLELLAPSKNSSAPLAIVARVTVNPTGATASPAASIYNVLMGYLTYFEGEKGPATFSKYWSSKAPIVFPSTFQSHAKPFAKSEETDPLWSPWFNSSHVLDSLNMNILGGWFDPNEAASVPVDAVIVPNGIRNPSQVPTAPSSPPAMARWVPHDAALAHFPSVGKFLELLDHLEDLTSGALFALHHDGENRMLRARYAKALGADEKLLVRLFEQGGADDLGLVSHDLSVRGTADLSLVIHLAGNGLLQLRQMLAQVGAGSNARTSKEAIGHRELSVMRTADGKVRSHLLIEGNWAVLSNSRVAVARLLDAYDGRQPSLALDAGYRYILSKDSAGADGAAFASASFWESQLTAQWRVAHRRRLLCAGALQVLSSAVLGYRRDQGLTPSLEQLTSNKYLFEDDLRCPDGGRIGIEDGVAHCSVHGTLESLAPAIEHLPRSIKPSERDGYLASAQHPPVEGDSEAGEPADWLRDLAFPVGGQFWLRDGFVAKLKTLPNTNSKAFEDLRNFAARKPSALGSRFSLPNTIGSLSAALDLEPQTQTVANPGEPQSKADTSDFEGNGRYALHRWLSGKAQLFVGDGATPFSVPLNRNASLDSTASILIAVKMWAGALYAVLSAPISGVFELKNPELAREAIASVFATRREAMREYVDRYDLLPYRETTIHVLSVPWIHTYLYFSFLEKDLVFSNRKGAILALVDQSIDKKTGATLSTRGQAAVELFPNAFNASRDASEDGWQGNLRRICHTHLASFELLAQSFGPKLAAEPQLSQSYFGFEAQCPQGGRYRFDAIQGGAYCTLHGRPGFSRQPIHLAEGAESRKLFGNVKHLAWSFGVTERTLETELRIERDRKSH